MRAALRFVRELESAGRLNETVRLAVELYGSLALTGKGHGTDRAVLLGLMGEAPDTVDPAAVDGLIAGVRETGKLRLGGIREIGFHEAEGLRFVREQMYPRPGVATHPNGMRLRAWDAGGLELANAVFYSVGGGFIVSQAEWEAYGSGATSTRAVPYAFHSAEEMLRLGRERGITIAEMVLANECSLLEDERVKILRPEAGGSTAERVPPMFFHSYGWK